MLGSVFKNFFSLNFNVSGKIQEQIPNTSPYFHVSSAFEEILRDIKQIIQPAIRETFLNRCLKPLLSILALVPPINEHIYARKTMLLDFDSFRAKLEKEIAAGRDASHPSSAKNLSKLDESSKRLFEVQQTIYALFDEFEAAKGVMLGAEFTSFMACYYHHYSSSTDIVSRLLPLLPQVSSTLSILHSKLVSGSDAAPSTSTTSVSFSLLEKLGFARGVNGIGLHGVPTQPVNTLPSLFQYISLLQVSD